MLVLCGQFDLGTMGFVLFFLEFCLQKQQGDDLFLANVCRWIYFFPKTVEIPGVCELVQRFAEAEIIGYIITWSKPGPRRQMADVYI